MVFLLTQLQAKWYAAVRPATWFSVPCDAHAHEETWEFDATEDELFTVILEGKLLQQQRRAGAPWFPFLAASLTPSSCQLLKISNILQFLSIIHLRALSDQRGTRRSLSSSGERVTVVARSESTCILPAFVPLPLGLLAAVLLFWVPFPDFGANKAYLAELRAILQHEVHALRGNDTSAAYTQLTPGRRGSNSNGTSSSGSGSGSARRGSNPAVQGGSQAEFGAQGRPPLTRQRKVRELPELDLSSVPPDVPPLPPSPPTAPAANAWSGAIFFASFIVLPVFAAVSFLLFAS
jgi:hypothetical protein